jgi:hypothetical protein
MLGITCCNTNIEWLIIFKNHWFRYFFQKEKLVQGFYFLILEVPITVKHSRKICSVCGGHLISINFPPRNWEGYYAYLSRMGGNLCLLVGVRTLPLLSYRHKNPPTTEV